MAWPCLQPQVCSWRSHPAPERVPPSKGHLRDCTRPSGTLPAGPACAGIGNIASLSPALPGWPRLFSRTCSCSSHHPQELSRLGPKTQVHQCGQGLTCPLRAEGAVCTGCSGFLSGCPLPGPRWCRLCLLLVLFVFAPFLTQAWALASGVLICSRLVGASSSCQRWGLGRLVRNEKRALPQLESLGCPGELGEQPRDLLWVTTEAGGSTEGVGGCHKDPSPAGQWSGLDLRLR